MKRWQIAIQRQVTGYCRLHRIRWSTAMSSDDLLYMVVGDELAAPLSLESILWKEHPDLLKLFESNGCGHEYIQTHAICIFHKTWREGKNLAEELGKIPF